MTDFQLEVQSKGDEKARCCLNHSSRRKPDEFFTQKNDEKHLSDEDMRTFHLAFSLRSSTLETPTPTISSAVAVFGSLGGSHLPESFFSSVCAVFREAVGGGDAAVDVTRSSMAPSKFSDDDDDEVDVDFEFDDFFESAAGIFSAEDGRGFDFGSGSGTGSRTEVSNSESASESDISVDAGGSSWIEASGINFVTSQILRPEKFQR